MSTIDGGKTNGYYDPKTDTIVIALDAKKGAYIAFAGHEIVHRIKVQDSKAYEELRNAVIKYLEEDGGFDLEERIREIQKVYETEKKQKLTRAQAVEEIVANSVIPAFSDENFSSNVAENNKTLAGKIREWIDEFINELKEIVSKLSKTKPEVKSVSKDIALLENIRNIIDESLSRTGGIREAQGERKLSASEDYNLYNEPITMEDVILSRSIGRKSVNKFTSQEIIKAQKWAHKFFDELSIKSPFFRAWFGDWREYSTNEVSEVLLDKTKTISSGNAFNTDMNRKLSWDKHLGSESILNASKE